MKILQYVRSTYIITIISGVLAILLAIALVVFPDDAFKASLQGLEIWWNIIFPALLPFFITAEVLLGFGVVHFMGVLLEPLMKPLFNVPGVGAFVLAMGFASGYPMGAKLTTRLREQKMITRIEGERLVSFTSTSDPLFLFGAIAVGFFHNVKLGALIAIVHYVSSILVGLIMRFYHKEDDERYFLRNSHKNNSNIIMNAFRAMHQARLNDGRKFGKLMGDAVMSSIQTLLMIGGFIIGFSVILAILTKVNVTSLFTYVITFVLTPLGISEQFTQPIIYGLFEVTNGAKYVSEASMSLPMLHKLAIVSAISAWSGISVHAQVAAILQSTDIRYKPFFVARILHSIIAFFLTFILWSPLNLKNTAALPAFMYNIPIERMPASFLTTFTYIGTHLIWLFIILFQLSLVLYILKRKYSR